MTHKITINGKVVELTTDEAKALLSELQTVFGVSPQIVLVQPPLYDQISGWQPPIPDFFAPHTTCRSN